MDYSSEFRYCLCCVIFRSGNAIHMYHYLLH